MPRKTTRTLIIKGGGSGEITTDYLEAVSDQIVRAKMARDPIQIDLDIFLVVLNELIERRREEKSDSDMVEEILSDDDHLEESFYLKISESRVESLHGFSDVEIFDLEDLEDFDGEMEALEELTEDDLIAPDEGEDDRIVDPPGSTRRAVASCKRQNYWVSSVDPIRVVIASIIGFVVLAFLMIVVV